MAEAQIFRGVDRLKLIAMIVGSKVTVRTACVGWRIVLWCCAGRSLLCAFASWCHSTQRAACTSAIDMCCLCERHRGGLLEYYCAARSLLEALVRNSIS
jgi:hypothetical protein